MSDSLRDQLKKAGFKESPETKKTKVQSQAVKSQGKGHSAKKHNASQQQSNFAAQKKQAEKKRQAKAELEKAETAKIAEKKAIKQQIKTIIEANCVKDHAGTVAYSYLLGSRVKQLFVKDELQKKLAAGDLLITRLNGNTYLVPPEVGNQIIALNPEWALIGGEHTPDDNTDQDTEYAEYQIPDDLTW